MTQWVETLIANGGNPYDLYIEVTQESQDVTGNRSQAHLKAWAHKKSGTGRFWLSSHDGWDASAVGPGGSEYSNSTNWTYDFRGISDLVFIDTDVWVDHAADGTGYVTFSVTVNDPSATPGSIGNGTASGTFNFTTIPRATTPSLSVTTVDAGGSVDITVTPASASFSHRVSWAFGSLNHKNASLSGGGGSAGGTDGTDGYWEVPAGTKTVTFATALSLLTEIPNATSGNCTVTVETYDGVTLIGTKTATLSITAPSSVKPTIGSLTITEATTTPDVATLIGALVQGVSKLTIAINGEAGAYGSTIVSRSVTVDSQTGTSDPWTTPSTISSSGTVHVSASVTDSRGRVSSFAGVDVTVLARSNPTFIDPPTLDRCDSAGTIHEDDGTYQLLDLNASVASLIVSSVEKNALSYQLKYLEAGTGDPLNPADYLNDGPAIAPGGLTFNSTDISVKGTYDVTKSYYMRVLLSDKLGEVASQIFIPKGLVLQHWNSNDGLGFGGYHSSTDNSGDSGEAAFVQVFGHVAQTQGGGTLHRLIDKSDVASTSEAGIAELATNSETQTGTDTTRAVTPAGLASLTATTSRAGLLKSATDAIAVAGSATDSALVPANLGALRALPVLGQEPSSVTVGSGSYTVEDDNLVTFSGVSSVNLNDLFDGLGADTYMVTIRGKCSTSATVLMRLRKAGSDLSSGYSYTAEQTTLSAGPGRSSSTGANYMYLTPAAFQAELSCTMHLFAPAILNEWTLYDSVTSAIGGGDRWKWAQSGQITTAVYTGLTLYVTAGTITGSIKVVKIA